MRTPDRSESVCYQCGFILTDLERYSPSATMWMSRSIGYDAGSRMMCSVCREWNQVEPFEPGDYRLLACAHAFVIRGDPADIAFGLEYTLTTEPPV